MDYEAARTEFCELTEQLGWECIRIPIELGTQQVQSASIDVALWNAGADRTLVVSSGLHGVEGPLGSAIQQAWMRKWLEAGSRPSVNILMLHAMNPWGWINGRRTDHVNRDLNRNFLRADERYAGVPELYRRLDWFINPPRAPRSPDWSLLISVPQVIGRYGLKALTQALAEGQYELPRGLFFGGKDQAPQHRAIRQAMKQIAAPDAVCVHLDLHTGLGGWGEHVLLCDHQVDSQRRVMLEGVFSGHAIGWQNQAGAGYRARGTLGQWIASQQLFQEYYYFCTEFGTYPAWKVFLALRAENQAHFWGTPGSRGTRRAKTRLREVFFPASTDWRESAVGTGVGLCDQASTGLARWGERD